LIRYGMRFSVPVSEVKLLYPLYLLTYYVYVSVCVDYMAERACFVTQTVVELSDNCSSEYSRQLSLVNSATNWQPHQIICRLFHYFIFFFAYSFRLEQFQQS